MALDPSPGALWSRLAAEPVKRTEDPRFVTGRARYTDDLEAPGALRAVFVRSPVAHARIGGVDVSEAVTMPGVVAVLTADDLTLEPLPVPGRISDTLRRPLLARDVVRFVGEPVAVVLAGSRDEATDAAEAVVVDYDPMEAVVDAETALADDATLLFPAHGSNVADRFERDGQGPLDEAELVVRGRFVNQRVAPVPLETNAVLASPDDRGRLTIWASTQIPWGLRDRVAETLGLPAADVRVIAPDVGGAFGAKLIVYPEQVVVAAAAQRLGRPIRWAGTRSEDMVSLSHGRAQVQYVEVGATRDGVLTGLRVRLVTDLGAYPTDAAADLPRNTYLMACGTYRIPKVAFEGIGVVTSTTPLSAYRGAGRPEATALIERAIDLVAAELGLDPADVRRRNLVPADAFPYATPTRAIYDVGDYRAALDRALELVGYGPLRDEQRRRRSRGDRRLLGIGMSAYVEVTAPKELAHEFGAVDVGEDGLVTVRTGIAPHGQGHETSLARITSVVLGVPTEAVRVVHSDTDIVPEGQGTMGSRSLQIGGSATLRNAESVLAKATRIAAHLLEASPDDIVPLDGGRLGVAGSPETGIPLGELAAAAADPDRLPPGMGPGLGAAEPFDQGSASYPFGAHAAVVEVDTDTGLVRLLRHVAVDDCGRVLNPALVDGQVHGGLAQGIAQALYEQVAFDELGNPQTASLVSYLCPTAPDLPSFDLDRPETPTPLNPLGAKGIGESATIGSTPAVQNAVVDALAHRGVRHIDLPATPERVWRALQHPTG